MEQRTFLYCPLPFEAQLGKREKRKKETLSGSSISIADTDAQYTGEWLEHIDTRQGYGQLVRSNGEIYEGYFMKDQFNGKGKLSFASNDEKKRKHYLGYFKDGKFHGIGTMTYQNQESFKGVWYKDKLIGQGKKNLSN